ncbi:MAG: hypothetical protein ROY99_12045 [Ignavibacterium sp.]|jgi:hypothetical protein|nr:hypothetical protein [Ignavibacterium sp.]
MKIKEKEFEEIIQELRSVASQLGATVRFEKGDFSGGYCLLNDDKVIVINKNANLQKKAMILSAALKELGVDDIYINPKLRELIEEMGDHK